MSYLERWNIYYEKLKDFCKEYGNINVPSDYVTVDGYHLGTWVVYQKLKFHKGLLSEEIIELLNPYIIWDINDEKWDNGYMHLLDYYKKNGNINMSQKYVTQDGYPLGAWVVSFKQAYNGKGKRKIDYDQIAMFNDLFIDWSPSDTKILNYEIVPGCCFDKYKKVMLDRMKHILEDLSYEIEDSITNVTKQKSIEEEIIKRMWR